MRSKVPARVVAAIVALADSQMLLGRPDRAEALHRWAVALCDRDSHDIGLAQARAVARASLANVLRLRGRYGEAEQRFREAIADAEATLGSNHPTLVPLLNGLGVVYKYTGRFDDAERLYRRALTLAEMRRAANSQELADLYHNLGGLAHARGRFADGAPLARRAVELRVRALGEDHPRVAADRAALAGILGPLGNAVEAESSRCPPSASRTWRLLNKRPASVSIEPEYRWNTTSAVLADSSILSQGSRRTTPSSAQIHPGAAVAVSPKRHR